jgi:hypothetical protein
MTDGDIPGLAGAIRGAGPRAVADGDIGPFAPRAAITYVFITPALTFLSSACARPVFDKSCDQAVTTCHGTELTLPAVNKHDSPFIASMDAAHARRSH